MAMGALYLNNTKYKLLGRHFVKKETKHVSWGTKVMTSCML